MHKKLNHSTPARLDGFAGSTYEATTRLTFAALPLLGASAWCDGMVIAIPDGVRRLTLLTMKKEETNVPDLPAWLFEPLTEQEVRENREMVLD